MICARCGQENPENATFCKKCGRRLDGMAICPNCGKFTPADGEFCIHCGANRNATVEENLKFQKEALESLSKGSRQVSTTSFYATSSKPAKKLNSTTENKPRNIKLSKFSKIFTLTSLISTSLLILCSTIFTFLVGATTQVSVGSASAGAGIVNFDIYYYFSDAFAFDSDIFGSDYILPASVLGLITVILAFIAVIVTLGFTIKGAISYFKKKEGDLTKYGVVSYFIFVSLATLFMLFISTSMEVASVTTSYVLNGATIAGIVIGGILLLITLVMNALNRGIGGNLKGYLYSTISTGVMLVFGVVGLAMIGGGLTTFISTYNLSTTFGIQPYFEMLTTNAITLYNATEDVWLEFVNNYYGSLVCVIFIVIFALIFALSFILTLKDNLSDFGGRYTKNSIIRSIVGGVSLTLVGVILLVHDLVCVSHYYNEDNGFTISLVLPIVIMVFGILFLAIAIANKVLDKTFFGEKIEESEITVNEVSPDLE